MTEEKALKAINDVVTGRKAELVLYRDGEEVQTLYEREIGFYRLRAVRGAVMTQQGVEASLWALDAEGFPYPIRFDEAKAR